jgi:hypothetical protein
MELIFTLWRLSAHTETNRERSKVIDGQNRDDERPKEITDMQ